MNKLIKKQINVFSGLIFDKKSFSTSKWLCEKSSNDNKFSINNRNEVQDKKIFERDVEKLILKYKNDLVDLKKFVSGMEVRDEASKKTVLDFEESALDKEFCKELKKVLKDSDIE